MNFLKQLSARVDINGSLLCIGLDSDRAKIPRHLADSKTAVFDFNKAIIDATNSWACAFKINSAFYEADGADGISQLKLTSDYLRQNYPDIPLILDAKRADIGNTNDGYVKFAFDYLGAGAVTVNPYLGHEALEPFLACSDKGIIILCRTSNPGGGELQDLKTSGKKLYQVVAGKVRDEWNVHGNCLLVAGATYPAELAALRRTMGDDFWFLVPGVGAQGGDIDSVVKAGVNSQRKGLIINSSRQVIFASSGKDFALSAARQARQTWELINKARE
ncbi:MAG TPA: orotidine-5'-phosphate decarboxylase [Candidatus Saccharimonadales bacterium]|nr:orotidine-5'-phosphate decarboxylase [Candidatus Saccharimonadales bacterium]